jgi:hypothetical protein
LLVILQSLISTLIVHAVIRLAVTMEAVLMAQPGISLLIAAFLAAQAALAVVNKILYAIFIPAVCAAGILITIIHGKRVAFRPWDTFRSE